ncbi:MAG: lysophospholipid acyltransferase family protein [Verrucomicrobiae bacterium]|nr:lysophospholipid acyltransferase family protein [Verrucomicrobiae bacterium]
MNPTKSKGGIPPHGRPWKAFSRAFYAVSRIFSFVVLRTFFRVRVVGRENCPPGGGPLIIACNHLSEWDPPLLGTSVPWQLTWVAKVELFELLDGRANLFFDLLHCISLDREKVDLSTMRHAVQSARQQRPLVVFAEGGIKHDETSVLGSTPQIKEGAATIALMAKCPILPAVLNGTMAAYDWRNWVFLRRPLMELVIGRPFTPSSRDRAAATGEILGRMVELRGQLQTKSPC